MTFRWYKAMGDGTALVIDDSPAVSKLVDQDPVGWYGNAEGCILFGGVQAIAVKRKTEMTYDAKVWLERGEMIPVGEITTTVVTAEPPE